MLALDIAIAVLELLFVLLVELKLVCETDAVVLEIFNAWNALHRKSVAVEASTTAVTGRPDMLIPLGRRLAGRVAFVPESAVLGVVFVPGSMILMHLMSLMSRFQLGQHVLQSSLGDMHSALECSSLSIPSVFLLLP
jgi:hypothetical protein